MSNSQLPVGRVSAMDAKPYVQVAQAGTRQLGRLDLETSKLIAGNTDPHGDLRRIASGGATFFGHLAAWASGGLLTGLAA